MKKLKMWLSLLIIEASENKVKKKHNSLYYFLKFGVTPATRLQGGSLLSYRNDNGLPLRRNPSTSIHMKQFAENLSIDSEKMHVLFSLVFTTKGHKLFVCIKRNDKNHFFDMTKNDNGKWIVENSAADWIKELESKLSEAISKNLDGKEES